MVLVTYDIIPSTAVALPYASKPILPFLSHSRSSDANVCNVEYASRRIRALPFLFARRLPIQSSVGASANRLNLRSSPAPFRNLLTPSSSAFSDNTSSASSSWPRFSGPLRRPSSSHRSFCAVFTKATKCRSTSAEAGGAAVAPCSAATA